MTQATPARGAAIAVIGLAGIAQGRGEAPPFCRVLLRAGRAGVAPLVLFHAVGGTVNLYGDLVAALDPALPVVAFQSSRRSWPAAHRDR